MAKVGVKFLIIAYLASCYPLSYAGEYDWMSSITKTCSPKITAMAKSLFDAKDFWVTTHVSMESWIEGSQIEKPEQTCAIRYLGNNKNESEYLRCMSYIKEQWDWLKRCMPVVNYECRKSGGLC